MEIYTVNMKYKKTIIDINIFEMLVQYLQFQSSI